MTLEGDLLNLLQKKLQRFQNLFGSGQPFSPVRKNMGGARFLSAFSRMRVLRPENLPLQNIQSARQLSTKLANQMENFANTIHFPSSAVARQNAYGAFDPVFPAPLAANPVETPAQPGELRAGMAISKMATVPQPGQSISSFREQTKASSLVKPPPGKSTIVKTPTPPTPGTRVFSKVVEGKQGQAPVEKKPEPPLTTAVNLPLNASAPAAAQDEPASATLAPIGVAKPAHPANQGTRPSANNKPTQNGTVTPPVIQRQADSQADPLPVQPSSHPEPTITPAVAVVKPAVEAKMVHPEQRNPESLSRPKPAESSPSSILPALPKAKRVAQPAPTPFKAQLLRQQPAPTQPSVVQKQADTADNHQQAVVGPGSPPQPISGQVVVQTQTPGPTPKAVPVQQKGQPSGQPAQTVHPLQEKLQKNMATKNLAIQRQPSAIHPRPSMQIGLPAEVAFGNLTSQNKLLKNPPEPAKTQTKGQPSEAEKPNFAPPAALPLAIPAVVQRSPISKTTPAVSVAPVVSQPANTTPMVEPALPTSTDHIPTVGIQRQTPGNVVQRLWEEHSEPGGQPGGGPTSASDTTGTSGQDVEGLAKKILPLVKHYLEIELERVGGRFGR